MRSHLLTLACLTAAALVFSANLQAVDLVGYYEFEGNFNNSSGSLGAAAASQNPGQVSFVPGGFRGQAVDINDPAANGGSNTGGSVDVPVNVSPPASYTFGGWVNLDTNAGFPGFVANDNGGWDRGIHMNPDGTQWGIASGGNLNNVAATTPGQWQYVVGTFNDATNVATLYVGSDVAATQTTAFGSRNDDAANNGGLAVLEIGRYDNQDLDAKVDDFFVFQNALTAEQVNAIRNLRLNPTFDYSVAESDLLLDLFEAGTGEVEIDDYTWTLTSGLFGTPGQLIENVDGSFDLVLNVAAGTGLNGVLAAVPEPATIAIWLVLGSVGFGYGWRKMRCRR